MASKKPSPSFFKEGVRGRFEIYFGNLRYLLIYFPNSVNDDFGKEDGGVIMEKREGFGGKTGEQTPWPTTIPLEEGGSLKSPPFSREGVPQCGTGGFNLLAEIDRTTIVESFDLSGGESVVVDTDIVNLTGEAVAIVLIIKYVGNIANTKFLAIGDNGESGRL